MAESQALHLPYSFSRHWKKGKNTTQHARPSMSEWRCCKIKKKMDNKYISRMEDYGLAERVINNILSRKNGKGRSFRQSEKVINKSRGIWKCIDST